MAVRLPAVQKWKRTARTGKAKSGALRKKRLIGKQTLNAVRTLRRNIESAERDIATLEGVKTKFGTHAESFDRAMTTLSGITGWKKYLKNSRLRAKWALDRKTTVSELQRKIDAEIMNYRRFIEEARGVLGAGQPPEPPQ